MIQDYEIERKIQTQGDTATLFFGLKAANVPVKDAIDAESEFTRFLSRVTGKQITTTAKPSETRTIIWTQEELVPVKRAATVEAAWADYHEKFPESSRTRAAIKGKWMELHKKPVPDPVDARTTGCDGCENAESGSIDFEKCNACSPPLKKDPEPPLTKVAFTEKKTRASGPVKPGRRKGNKFGIPNELKKTDKKLFDRLWQRCKSHGITYEEALNFKPTKPGRKPKAQNTSKQLREAIDSSNEWTLEEDAAIRECPNEDMALTHFLNKFPESTRTAVEVSQRWQELKGLADEMAEEAEA